jgi:hypothetical protein
VPLEARRLPALCLAALGLPGAALAQPLAWSGEVSLGSELSVRGVAYWRDQPVAQAVVAVSDAAVWSASFAAARPFGDGQGSQLVLRASGYWVASTDVLLQGRVAAYAYPGMRYDRDHGEATLAIAWRDIASIEASAVRMKEGDSRWYPALDLGLRWPLSEHWSLAAGAGWAELPAWPGLYYHYGDVGVAWRTGDWRATLTHLRASHEVRRYMHDAAAPRTALALTLQF